MVVYVNRGVIKLNVDIIWNNVLKEIKEELSSLAFSTWFQEVNLKDLKDDTALKLKALKAKSKITNKYSGDTEPQEGSILDFNE